MRNLLESRMSYRSLDLQMAAFPANVIPVSAHCKHVAPIIQTGLLHLDGVGQRVIDTTMLRGANQ